MNHNVVQVEYFLVDVQNSPSLGAHRRARAERAFDNLELAMAGADVGTGIKLCVRFYDQTGKVTRATSVVEDLEDRTEKAFTGYLETRWPGSVWFEILHQYLRYRERHARDALRNTVLESLSQAMASDAPIAIETTGHAFRLLQSNESHETLETARKTRQLWVFVFMPNDLCADTNELVTSAS